MVCEAMTSIHCSELQFLSYAQTNKPRGVTTLLHLSPFGAEVTKCHQQVFTYVTP